jgi:hypothetical protein
MGEFERQTAEVLSQFQGIAYHVVSYSLVLSSFELICGELSVVPFKRVEV